MKKAALVLLLLLLISPRTKEISDYSIVSGIAVDLDGEYTVTVEVLRRTQDGFGSSCEYLEASGATPAAAMDKIAKKSADTLYTDCNQLIILSENAIDYAWLQAQAPSAATVITPDRAGDILKEHTDTESTRSNSLSYAKKIRSAESVTPDLKRFLETKKAPLVRKDEVPTGEYYADAF